MFAGAFPFAHCLLGRCCALIPLRLRNNLHNLPAPAQKTAFQSPQGYRIDKEKILPAKFLPSPSRTKISSYQCLSPLPPL